MNWPEIAATIRKLWNVEGERVGHLEGKWRDPAGTERYGFTANSERGGTKLVLVIEVEDFDALPASVSSAVKAGIENVFLAGRMVSMKQTVDTMSLTRPKLEEAAKALADRGDKLRRGRMS